MKRLIFILGISCLLCACNDDVIGTLYDEASLGSGFSFAGTVLNTEVADEDGGVVRVPVYRGKGAPTVASISCEFYDSDSDSWQPVDPEGLFRLATSRVVFIDDADVAYAQVSFSSIEDLGITAKHSFRLQISDGVSVGGNSTCNVTVCRRLTFKSLGMGRIFDEFLSDSDVIYDVEILKAEEAEVYRVMRPFNEMLVTEGFQAIGWMTTPTEYLQIEVHQDGSIRFDEYRTGMCFNKIYVVYAVDPSERTEHADVDLSSYSNRKPNQNKIELDPFYYMKGYGYFMDRYTVHIYLPEN